MVQYANDIALESFSNQECTYTQRHYRINLDTSSLYLRIIQLCTGHFGTIDYLELAHVVDVRKMSWLFNREV